MVLRYTGAVDETGSQTVRDAEELKELFANLMTTAKSICGSEWTGAAAEAFETAQLAWDSECAGLTNAHSEMGMRTQQASENAFGADLRGAGLFNA